MANPKQPASPSLDFNSSPEIIRLIVMMYVELTLNLRNVEDLLAERGTSTARRWANGGTGSAGDLLLMSGVSR